MTNGTAPVQQPVTVRTVTAAASAVVLVGGVVAFWYNEQVGIRALVETNDRELRAHVQRKVEELRKLTLNQTSDAKNAAREQYNIVMGVDIKDMREQIRMLSERVASQEATMTQAMTNSLQVERQRIETRRVEFNRIWTKLTELDKRINPAQQTVIVKPQGAQ